MPKMYTELATWWHLLSPPDEYLDEVAFFRQVFAAGSLPFKPTLLELGCGGGNIAFYLKEDFFQVTLTDLSPQMVAMSRAINPECEHLVGDMRTLRLERTFDVVFVHDAIDYMLTLYDLRLALETTFLHCKAGGLAIFVPDHVQETFEPSTDHGGTDGDDGNDGDERALRYLEWTYDPNSSDTTYTTDYTYVLRENNQLTRIEHDQHICGLFPREEWLRLLREVGFEPEVICDEYERDVFVARKPGPNTV